MKQQYTYIPKYSTMTKKQVIDAIRLQWSRYKVKFAAIQARAERHTLENGHAKTLIRCDCCGGLFVREAINAHHTKPVGALLSTAREDVEAFINRMFCKKGDIQVLCVECHKQAHSEDYEFKNGSEFNEVQV